MLARKTKLPYTISFFLIMRRQADKLISLEIDKSYKTICVTINENISSVNALMTFCITSLMDARQ